MPDHIEIPLQKLLVFEGDNLIFDGSDCSTCTVLGPGRHHRGVWPGPRSPRGD